MDLGGIATMNGGGPMISGAWMNTHTGETITVRDSFMDGENMIIMLTDGRQLTLNDFQDYVQMSDEEYDMNGNVIGKVSDNAPTVQHHNNSNVDAATVFAGMEKNINVQAESDLNNIINESEKSHIETTEPKTVKKYEDSPVDKILEKVNKPKFVIKLQWDEFPKNELLMCKKYLDIDDDDIVKSIISHYCTGYELEAAIIDWFKNAI